MNLYVGVVNMALPRDRRWSAHGCWVAAGLSAAQARIATIAFGELAADERTDQRSASAKFFGRAARKHWGSRLPSPSSAPGSTEPS
jgi:hypothetical protein